MQIRLSVAALFGSLLLISSVFPVQAKPARCFTTDDGKYGCDFRTTDKSGSFTISAPGKPTFTIEVDSPGVAFGFADFGTGRAVPLPGRFERDRNDAACWNNAETNTQICAW